MHFEYIALVAVMALVTSAGTTATLAATGRGPIGMAQNGPATANDRPREETDATTVEGADPGTRPRR